MHQSKEILNLKFIKIMQKASLATLNDFIQNPETDVDGVVKILDEKYGIEEVRSHLIKSITTVSEKINLLEY